MRVGYGQPLVLGWRTAQDRGDEVPVSHRSIAVELLEAVTWKPDGKVEGQSEAKVPKVVQVYQHLKKELRTPRF